MLMIHTVLFALQVEQIIFLEMSPVQYDFRLAFRHHILFVVFPCLKFNMLLKKCSHFCKFWCLEQVYQETFFWIYVGISCSITI